MRSRGAAPLVVAVVAGLALTACGASVTDRPSTPSRTSSSAPSVTPPSAAAAVARLTQQMDAAGTGTYAQTTRTRGETFTLDQVTDTSFDLGHKSWTTHTHYEGTPPPDSGSGDLTQIDMTMVVAGGTAYLTMAGWPTKWRGRWLRLEPNALPSVAPQQLGGEPFAVVALRRLSGTSVDLAADGTSTVKGHIDLETAVGLLGLQTGVVKAGIDPSTLSGHADVTVVTDRQGRPVELTLDGRDVVADTTLPSAMTTVLPLEIATVHFDRLGSPVEIAVPATSSLIDPAEMRSGT